MIIDLNADLGEGMSTDSHLFPLITSASIACGFHAGDPQIMFSSLHFAKTHNVIIGAHPGHPDREHFGRQELNRTAEEVFADTVYQVSALIGLAKSISSVVRYVKPHGGLYHQACRDSHIAQAICKAAKLFDLAVIGLPESVLEKTCHGEIPFFREGFADRRYQPDGNLVPRNQPHAMIHDVHEAVQQVEWLIEAKSVRTICVHGDNPDAVLFVKTLRESLLQRGHQIKAFR